MQDARQKKSEKATQRATELIELKNKILQTENNLKDTEQKLSQRISNTEVETEVQKDASEKRPRVVVKEPEVVEKPKPASWDLTKLESPLRTSALIIFAVGSFYMKNLWRRPVVAVPAPVKTSMPSPESKLPAHPRPSIPTQTPLSSLFKRL